MYCHDVKLRQTTNGEEFLEYLKRQTKTRTGENPREVRKIKPKCFRFLEVKKKKSDPTDESANTTADALADSRSTGRQALNAWIFFRISDLMDAGTMTLFPLKSISSCTVSSSR